MAVWYENQILINDLLKDETISDTFLNQSDLVRNLFRMENLLLFFAVCMINLKFLKYFIIQIELH